MIICPFCGGETESTSICEHCCSRLDKKILSISYTPENDPRSDKIGPFSTKTAKRIGWVVIGILLVLFVIFTEMNGGGFTQGRV